MTSDRAQEGIIARTVCALTDEIARERCATTGATAHAAGNLVLAQVRRMPTHLAWPLGLATLGFGLTTMVRTGRPFDAAPTTARRAQVERWRRARLAPLRDLVRFYESLAVFACFAVEERDGG